jgi:flagellar M-ring protein FliF
MKDTLAGALERVRTTLSAMAFGQKVVIGLLTVGLVLGGWFFYRWITTPTYAPLFSNLAASDASAIVDELNSEGVSYQLADGGATVEVPQDKVYDLRLTMSGKGLPAGNTTGYSLLDQQGITTSQFQQQVTYQRALEGELAKTLQALDGVQTAVVHLAIPKEQVFTDDQQKPTASVLMSLKPGKKLSGEQVQAVTHLVSSSIQGMDAAQVTVADAQGNVLSAAGSGVDSAVSDVQSQQEQAFEAQLASNAQSILDKVLGADHSTVQVRADLDFSQRSTTSETYNYTPGTPPVSQSTTSEKYSGAGSAVGGVLGPENQSNASTTGSGNGSYDKSTATSDNAVGKTTTTEQQAPGQVKRLTVSVVLDGAKAGALNQQQVTDLIGNAVGLDTARGDGITVAALPFDQTAAQAAAQEVKDAEAAASRAQMVSLVKNGAIGLAVLLVVLVAWLRSRKRKGAEEYEEEYEEPLALTEEQLLELERLRVDSVRDTGVEDQALALEAAQRQRVRGEISSMVAERPDEVAQMLRGWLTESRS